LENTIKDMNNRKVSSSGNFQEAVLCS